MEEKNKILSIDEITIILPKRLKFYRLQKGLSLRDVAIKINKSPSQVSFWERGINPPTCIDLFRLCQIYNISLADLFPGIKKEYKPSQHEIELLKKYRLADKEVKTTILKILEYTYSKNKEF